MAARAKHGERGQAAVLSALCLFSMVVFLALATNMGTLVNERIRLQNAADLAAYAGAHTQAEKLNDIAALNKTIQDVATYCRVRLTQRAGPNILGLGWNKIWNQCLPETPMPPGESFPQLPIPPVLKTVPPVHALIPPPPNSDTGKDKNGNQIPGAPGKYGPTFECSSDWDSRADDLIEWCQRTMDYYAQIIFDINDYGAAYYGVPLSTSSSSVLFQRPIFKQGQNRGAVRLTARANYPQIQDSAIEMLDQPSNSPVRKGRFYQDGTLSNEAAYDRTRGESMVPMTRYMMRFNYVYMCCGKAEDFCSIAKCGNSGNVPIPNVGHVPDYPARYAYKEFATIHIRLPEGLLYMPVRLNANPKDRTSDKIAYLDLPDKTSNYFGGWQAWNDLRATAVAKPYEGVVGPSLFHLDSVYKVNQEVSVPFPRALNGVYVAGGLQDMWEDEIYGYDTYRARMAGFREPLQDGSYDSMLQVLVKHATARPLPSDKSPQDYEHTSH